MLKLVCLTFGGFILLGCQNSSLTDSDNKTKHHLTSASDEVNSNYCYSGDHKYTEGAVICFKNGRNKPPTSSRYVCKELRGNHYYWEAVTDNYVHCY